MQNKAQTQTQENEPDIDLDLDLDLDYRRLSNNIRSGVLTTSLKLMISEREKELAKKIEYWEARSQKSRIRIEIFENEENFLSELSSFIIDVGV